LFGITMFPGAAYEATTYNSVLGDLAETSNYDLVARTTHYINEWLGAWYLVLLGCMVLVPIDAAVAWWRGTSPALVRARAGSFLVATGTAVLIGWFLIGAPWTSLEWTRGLSLRYALPWFALLPLVAWLALFPVSLPWYRRFELQVLGGVVFVGGGLAIFSGHLPPPFPPMPTLTSLLAALALWAVVRLSARGTRGPAIAVVAALVVASAGFGVWAAKADVLARGELSAAMAAGPRNEEEQVYDAALASEGRDAVTCAGRRFFITTRFNLPLALQGARLANEVFYAGRDLSVTATVRPAMGPCDYIVTDEAVLGTTKGANLHAALAGASATLTRAATLEAFVLLVNR
jgi:hypothetical protein